MLTLVRFRVMMQVTKPAKSINLTAVKSTDQNQLMHL
uniref:Uncharacterized protein n=1 Tax=Siphoviridae sp. ctoiW10 TaxID=2827592 RepID=A0A8S5LPF1_9CAUD|nr:MAG TPA: hypothetical protein [Siphoviridae sp. ctoiW10]